MIVRSAESSEDYAAVSRLMRAFVAWHYERHASDRAIIDSYFDPEKFEAELAGLPVISRRQAGPCWSRRRMA
jgi:putative acetyltransferase